MLQINLIMLAFTHLFAAAQLPMLGLVYTPMTWWPIALIAVLVVILVAAIVYILAGIIASTNARAWARIQIYEAFLSIVLIMIFGFFSYLFFLSPQAAMGPNGLNLVPQSFSILGYTIQSGCSSANDIFQLSVCDLSLFNGAVSTTAEFFYYVSYITGIVPTLDISLSIPEYEDALSVDFSDIEIFPGEIDNVMPVIYSAMMFALLISQLQLIILAGSLLFLSVFLTLGLVMRTFGVTRSFGGAMIAFGLGLGLVFPLLTAITYGFLDVQINAACYNVCGAGELLGNIFGFILSYLTGASVTMPSVGFFGYLVVGLTFIPFLNFTIVDAFIVDFSKAIGERMDFMSLLSNII